MLYRMAFSSLIQDVWLLGLVLQAVLAAVLVGRGRWRGVPVFLLYILFNLVEAVVGYFAQSHWHMYLYVYICGEAIAVILGLAVFYEIFSGLLITHPALRRIATAFFVTVLILLVVLAVGVIAARGPLGWKNAVAAVLLVEEAARILELGLIVFLFSFSTIFGLHWRQPVFGIALGLGALTLVKLVEVTLLPNAGPMGTTLRVVGMVTFDLTLLLWLGYTLAPERAADAELPQRAQLEQWNRAVMELIHQ